MQTYLAFPLHAYAQCFECSESPCLWLPFYPRILISSLPSFVQNNFAAEKKKKHLLSFSHSLHLHFSLFWIFFSCLVFNVLDFLFSLALYNLRKMWSKMSELEVIIIFFTVICNILTIVYTGHGYLLSCL